MMNPESTLIEPDCLGRTRLAENQMQAMIVKIKAHGLLNEEPPKCSGRGIIIAGGGKYLNHAGAVCLHLRNLGWTEGIQVWHLGPKEMTEPAREAFAELQVEVVDALEMRKMRPMRRLGGWELKTYAIMNCPWRHVMFLDADCIPTINPAEIFNHVDVEKVGSIFFSDTAPHNVSPWGYIYAGLKRGEKEWEAGQYVVDKQRAWMGLRWTFWLLEHSDVWFRLGHGDKFTTELGFRISGVPHLVSKDCRWEKYGIGQYWRNARWFKHCMSAKRGEYPWPMEFANALADWDVMLSGAVPSHVPVPAGVARSPLFVR